MDKFSKIRRILILILAFNWLVAFSKIAYGLITKCVSMTADGFHSFGDGASNIIGLIGIWAASRPRDETHPYGHKKFETIATLGIAVILFAVSFNIIKEAVERMIHPVMPDVRVMSFVLMALTICINIFVMRYEQKKGRQLASDILICDSLHTRSDIFASFAVVGTLISIRLGFSFLDTIVAGMIAVLIAKSGIDIIKASSNVLCDGNVLANTKIKEAVNGIGGIRSIHKIRTRGRQDDIHVDLHVTIDAKLHVDQAHEISHKIESTLKRKISGVTDVSVHIEPCK
ncbi:MAG: cation diffusion facilitator family transporter [Candidatus Omnitrophica bacterium]|nr:cation diffusion facilitator family transporter [Candidatus Omnitrophota bacterium]